MKARFADRWPLAVAPLLLFAVGLTLTISKQPPRVERTPATIREGNPIFAWAFLSGAGAEVLIVAAWVLVIALPSLLLPRLLAIGWGFGWTFGHAATVMGWLTEPVGYGLGYWTLYWYCPIIAGIFMFLGHYMFGRRQADR